MDKRISTLREILFGIRVVKCYAWEDAMQKLISGMRKEEVQTRVPRVTCVQNPTWDQTSWCYIGLKSEAVRLTLPKTLTK